MNLTTSSTKGSAYWPRVARAFTLTFLFTIHLFTIHPTHAKPVDADLAIHSVDIDHDFKGMDILMFGARNDVGQVLVVLRGPDAKFVVRKKERIAGIWANRDSVTFHNAPTLYHVAATTSLENLQNDNLLNQLAVGVDHLPIRVDDTDKTEAELKTFWNAFVDYQSAKELYSRDIKPVQFWGETLFRTELPFSKYIDRGWHTGSVYLINDGSLSSMQSTPIEVRKIGLEAFLFDMAHEQPFFYGILSVLMALVAGWTASRLFGRIR